MDSFPDGDGQTLSMRARPHLGATPASDCGRRGRPRRGQGCSPSAHAELLGQLLPFESVSTVIVGFDQASIEEEINIIKLCQTLQASREQRPYLPSPQGYARTTVFSSQRRPSFTSTSPFQSLTSSLDKVTDCYAPRKLCS